jgi:hypothetical protein
MGFSAEDWDPFPDNFEKRDIQSKGMEIGFRGWKLQVLETLAAFQFEFFFFCEMNIKVL